MNNAVHIVDVAKTYPGAAQPAVAGLSLDIAAGTLFGLLGPNGAGKTTLLSMLCGLFAADRGRIELFGCDVGRDPQAARRLFGLVPQELAIYPTLTARENLAFFGAMQGLRGAALKARIDACLAIAGLEPLADRRPAQFSGGLKRRLNLVIGLVHEPRLLILDEPTVGIDPQSRHFIHQSLRELNAAGMTIIYTTHYMEEVEQLCRDIAIVDHGKLIAHGSLQSLLAHAAGDRIEVRIAEAPGEPVRDAVRAEPYWHDVSFSDTRIVVRSREPVTALPRLLALLHAHGLTVLGSSYGATDLEQVFLHLTGTRLRD